LKLENLKCENNPEYKPDLRKIDAVQPIVKDTKKLENISKLSDREKIAYYRKHGLNSLADNRKAIMKNNEKNGGLNYELTKMNSHNMDKLAEARKLKNVDSLKESFEKWNKAAHVEKSKKNIDKKKLFETPFVFTRHVKKGGEHGTITYSKNEGGGGSGIFVNTGSVGKTPEQRIKANALPAGNRAEIEARVKLNPEIKRKNEPVKTHNILFGQIGPQPKWDDKANDGIKRTGGARQIVTNGGIYKPGCESKKEKYISPVEVLDEKK